MKKRGLGVFKDSHYTKMFRKFVMTLKDFIPPILLKAVKQKMRGKIPETFFNEAWKSLSPIEYDFDGEHINHRGCYGDF